MTATREAPAKARTSPAGTAFTPNIDVAPVRRRPARRLPWPLDLYQTAVGKKWVMALTGIMLMGFVFAHMIGNLKMYLGPEEFDVYAEGLRSLLHPIFPDHFLLWVMRIGLIGAFVVHLHAAYSLTIMNRRSRPVQYQSRRDYLAANWASRTMRWSGVLVLAFLFMHLANLTWGWFPSGVHHGYNTAYDNVVVSLEIPWLAALYILGNIALAFHLYHGAWSLFQSLGINNPHFNVVRRGFAIVFAAVVCGVNITFPIAVLAGLVDAQPVG